jgi:hypothetical protein
VNRDTPTQPPSAADDAALAFSKRVAVAERGRRTSSGLIRALAEAWAESETKK